jgi:hypothetical protein
MYNFSQYSCQYNVTETKISSKMKVFYEKDPMRELIHYRTAIETMVS